MSPRPAPIPSPDPPVVLQDRAAEQIRYIRDVMARAGEFTAVPGWGGVVMGLTALVAAPIAAAQRSEARWLSVWAIEAALALAIGGAATARKVARDSGSTRALGTGP